ncbi:unnamed protein product [Paramecium sonneborni]|uniref:Beta-lactamase class A catalytic domain-containing protein n=1 Tax=Paramecium sonneborni TaxID=65129 RepID=A0A8S1L6W4_9CILI|nr:unnamed protein product [Paramecium sonneborni]
MKSIYCLLSIFVIVFSEQVTSDETTYAYFNLIKDAYNQQNPRRIYNLFSQISKDSLSYEKFSKEIMEIYDRSGRIAYWTHISINSDNPEFTLGFEKNLAVGGLIWTYSDKNFLRFALYDFAQPTMIDFFQNNQNKVTFTAITDGKTLIDYFGNRDQDLMSVFKITVAIEFSRQANEKIIDKDQFVSINDINKFFVPSIDIYHQQFLDIWKANDWIVDNKMKLQDVVKGMIAFSSNSCTEFLQSLLTMKSIQELVDSVKLHQTQAYYLASYQLSYLNLHNLPNDEYIKEIDSLTSEQVLNRSNNIHNILVTGSQEAINLLKRGNELLNAQVLAIQTKQFTKSTTNAYAKLMDQLNNQELFDQGFYDIFYPLIGIVELSNPGLKKLFNHVGAKGGSSAIQNDTACVFSQAQFSELQHALPYKTISYAFFMENLFWDDYESIIIGFNSFKTMLSTNGLYLNAVAQKLKQIS